MSTLEARMKAATGGGAVDVSKILARGLADGGGSGNGDGIVDRRPRLDRQVSLG